MISVSTVHFITQRIELFVMVMVRLSTTLATLTFFRRELVPAKIMLFFTMALSFLICSTQSATAIPPLNFYTSLLCQAAYGLLIAFVVNIFMEIFLVVGQLVSTQSGLGFINLYIPKVGSITSLSHFFMITATLLFFQLNGHLLLIKLVMESIQLDALSVNGFHWSTLLAVLHFSKGIFSDALMLSLSALIALLISNLSIAVLTKFAPQLNILSIGINITLIVCFFMVYMGFDGLLENGQILLNEVMGFVKGM